MVPVILPPGPAPSISPAGHGGRSLCWLIFGLFPGPVWCLCSSITCNQCPILVVISLCATWTSVSCLILHTALPHHLFNFLLPRSVPRILLCHPRHAIPTCDLPVSHQLSNLVWEPSCSRGQHCSLCFRESLSLSCYKRFGRSRHLIKMLSWLSLAVNCVLLKLVHFVLLGSQSGSPSFQERKQTMDFIIRI